MSVKKLNNEHEDALLRQIKEGDYASFDELYSRHWSSLKFRLSAIGWHSAKLVKIRYAYSVLTPTLR